MSERGPFTDLVVEGPRTITGDVVGVHVRSGGGLTLTGRLTGPIRIGAGGSVAVTGLLDLSDVENAGTLAGSGLVLGTREQLDAAGSLGVVVGSMVNDQVLDADGTLVTPLEDMEVTVDSKRLCVWVAAAGRFFGER